MAHELLRGLLKDALTHSGLQLTKCRGQTYDGASNMSGNPFTTRTFLNTIDVNLIIQLSEEAFKMKVKHMKLTSKVSGLGHTLFGGENVTFSNIPC